MSTVKAARPFEHDPQNLTERQKAMVKKIVTGPRGRIPVNLRAWLHNMDFADVVEPFGLYVTHLSPLTKRQREIVTLVHAQHWQAAFEWGAHVKWARSVGITEEQIEAIKNGQRPVFGDLTEDLTWELVYTLHTDKHINDDLHARALDHFGHKGVMELIGLIGLYTMVAMTLNFYDVPAGHLPPEDLSTVC